MPCAASCDTPQGLKDFGAQACLCGQPLLQSPCYHHESCCMALLCVHALYSRATARTLVAARAAVVALAYAVFVCCRHVMAMNTAPPESIMHQKCATTLRLTAAVKHCHCNVIASSRQHVCSSKLLSLCVLFREPSAQFLVG